jgi:hypothetical protein
MISRSGSVVSVTLAVLLVLPLHAGTKKADFLARPRQTCTSTLAAGEQYQIQRRAFRWTREGSEVYTDAVAYYALGSGEFFWWGMGYTKAGYERDAKNSAGLDCAAPRHDFLELQDGEWADFWGNNGGIRVFHSKLRFPSIEKGWQYVAEHPDETSEWWGGKWVELISLDKELGSEFFRPERLRYDARVYFYDSLLSVKKVGSTWLLEIKGADEPNRALVELDSDFKLIKVTKAPPGSTEPR